MTTLSLLGKSVRRVLFVCPSLQNHDSFCQEREYRLWIQIPDAKIQISGKGNPDKIGDIQPCSPFGNTEKTKDHDQNEYPQQDQPEESEQVPSEIKEKSRPEEINSQLPAIDGKSICNLFFAGTGCQDKIRRDSHKQIQEGPYYRKQPGWRRQRRLIQRPEGIHFVTG